ncbi:M48 family metallopeptidase [Phormidium sp. CLA17]|nr:M48 family metallopeptidase [Leptolyngbya sp. Cla-17]
MSLEYIVRESPKAKHVSLKMSITGNLEVIIPKGFDQKRIPEILEKKQSWIERVTRRMVTQQALAGVDVVADRPERITLQAIAENWHVEYSANQKPGIRAKEYSGYRLVLQGDMVNADDCKTILQRWIAHKARVHFSPWLRSISHELALPFQGVSIRQQKTIWGSCSIRKTISLNSKLLFLPPSLVRYVLIHELCHTIHLNHSSNFWALVGTHEPDYKVLDDNLRDARYLVPWWMEQ